MYSYMTPDKIRNQFKKDVRLEATDICLSYMEHMDRFGVFNEREMHTQMREWRDWLKSGKIYILKENNKTLHIDGVEYHSLVIQGKGINMSKMGLLFDECFMVDGWFYVFKSKKTRDTVFNWIYKYCQIALKDTENDGDECNICMDDEECLFITKCCGKDICRTCVKEKRTSSCPFCRKAY